MAWIPTPAWSEKPSRKAARWGGRKGSGWRKLARWAERAGLAFRPLATEAYGLIVKARDLGDARVVRLCEVAQGAAFRREAGGTAGYDPAGSGDIRYDA